MKISCADVVKCMEEIAPTCLAEDWDNVGLIIGDLHKEINHIFVCLDVISDTVDYAEKNKVDIMITHHPLIFRSIKSIKSSDWNQRLIMRLIKRDICVYSAHTNLDYAEKGVSWHLARTIGLVSIENFKKETDKKSHNFGKIGELFPPQDPEIFINNIKRTLNIKGVRLIGTPNKKISKVAVFSGSFDEEVLNEIPSDLDIDIIISGDIKYHTAIQIKEMGICAIDAGHFGTENIIVAEIANRLRLSFPNIKISWDTMGEDPFIYR